MIRNSSCQVARRIAHANLINLKNAFNETLFISISIDSCERLGPRSTSKFVRFEFQTIDFFRLGDIFTRRIREHTRLYSLLDTSAFDLFRCLKRPLELDRIIFDWGIFFLSYRALNIWRRNQTQRSWISPTFCSVYVCFRFFFVLFLFLLNNMYGTSCLLDNFCSWINSSVFLRKKNKRNRNEILSARQEILHRRKSNNPISRCSPFGRSTINWFVNLYRENVI